ncbi:MAG: PQQ-binding-like beta-propeller repeat protein [Planctomycetaceae bacterium]
MIRSVLLAAFVFSVTASAVLAQSVGDTASNWHQWRGPDATGSSLTAKPPVRWSETENVQWKVKIDGNGSSVPIVWGEKVFLLTAINTKKVDPSLPKPEDQPKRIFGVKDPNTSYQYVVICLNRNTGDELWRDVAVEKIPNEGVHRDNDFASASPTTDGERLYCWFGSAGLFCYDLSGKRLWAKQLGEVKMGARLGEGCSPVLHDGKLVIVRDCQQQSYIVVLDAKTGDEIWRKNRDEGNGWATPRVISHSGKTQVVMPGTKAIRSYDLANGDLIWQCSGLTSNCIPCPVVQGDVVYCMTGYEGHKLMALPLSAKGDITGSEQILWTRDKGTPYVSSPVLFEGHLYFNKFWHNILTSVDVGSGKEVLGPTRLPTTDIYASPVAANGHVYFVDRTGKTVVLNHSDKLEVIAKNQLDDRVDASPALAGNQLFIRGTKHLYCLSDESRE